MAARARDMFVDDAHLQDERDLRLRWSGRWTLSRRILAFNILALALLAGGFFYLDSYRARLIDQRTRQVVDQAQLIAAGADAAPRAGRAAFLRRLGAITKLRLRVYEGGALRFDSWRGAEPTYRLRDPASQPWQRSAARTLDRATNFIVGADSPAPFAEPRVDRAAAWPEARAVASGSAAASRVRQAPDLTPVISAAVPIVPLAGPTRSRAALLATINARDVTRIVRAERLRLGVVLLAVTLASVLLSLFLARTIARPLRRLAIAAHRVRLGRAREVRVPRLPSRRDEIGLLARALHDMTQSLRTRIDATEAFAADVTHELKNPLASLRSAVDTLGAVKDPALQDRLLAVVRDDVRRLDRLIVDIAEASRVDAELSRAKFEPVDLGALIGNLVTAWETRGVERDVRLAFARPRAGTTVISGEAGRLARAIDNLIDNAISFSPDGGLVEVGATRVGADVVVRVDDEGPGVPPAAREEIFARFHSLRPEGEAFGRHSGLGLAIARAIVEGHGGTIVVRERDDRSHGARFLVSIPARVE
ncbi:MAG: Sensor histidine kinase ChvG [uncultured Sphingomonadaceae bacterium]|uniref:histidine kinase n=1 Tax=uncultured Sphingomonadaceae bacterium TaxID=169976 RepID=A0A6J4S601_9SPHN|nr:MAG: Sensor histidine kinase ChvG [uncultured Sphingomonadaceae bacterium]